MSAVVLAGGKSSRMGTDKAFLDYGERAFISLITDQLLRVSDDVIVAIGRKDRREFDILLRDERIRIINDTYYLENPLGGILSAFERVRHDYSFVVACDSPLLRESLVDYLYHRALGFSAAIPVWDAKNPITCEPLCGAYNVDETRRRIVEINSEQRCKHLVFSLQNVNFIPVQELRYFDPSLSSLVNVNSRRDYQEIVGNEVAPIVVSPQYRSKSR
jgi:molybdopterin-guanine dinucleotide biosynthesis protein A